MNTKKTGVAFAGNILTDVIKTIDAYPQTGMLCNISEVSQSVGGCVPNTAINLAKIDPGLPLSAIGRVGADEYGRYVTGLLRQYGINTDRITVSDTEPTSFTDVMNIRGGERTFFHARGANREFAPAHVDIPALDCRILHIGYILLLDAFDQPDNEYGTVMARFLHDVQQQGVKTSVDAVSDSTADYQKTILPALKYCDYAILNEIESTTIWGLSPRTAEGKLHVENIRETMRRMAEAGVREKVIVHAKEAGFAFDVATGAFTVVPSLRVPSADIKGSTGAGDAFCAACLYGLYHALPDDELLAFASAAAVCNLFADNGIDGMRSAEEIRKLETRYERRNDI